METEITCDWIDRYNNDELNENEKAIFEERMGTNHLLRSEVHLDDCLNRFLMDEGLLDLMKKISSSSQKNQSRGSWWKPMLIAATLLCLTVMGGLFYLLQTNPGTIRQCVVSRTDQPLREHEVEPEKLTPLTDFQNPLVRDQIPHNMAKHMFLLAEAFQPLTEFDLLIGSVTRSDYFKLITPDPVLSIPAGTRVLFSWTYDERSEPVSIILMNNKGIPVFEMPLTKKDTFVLNTGDFLPGLYYWKILAGDDLVLMGKLTIL
ncbi:MAG: hypothetical protein Q8M08_08270 [Bacteroidales bacterium]|nr:hypothetical protein [Bacteroidales bacterium]